MMIKCINIIAFPGDAVNDKMEECSFMERGHLARLAKSGRDARAPYLNAARRISLHGVES
jgi:hypothetical protein